jgi:hypothetical protein
VAWIPEATLALETAESLESSWGLRMALAYRGFSFGGQVSLAAILRPLLCRAHEAARQSGGGAAPNDVLYSLQGTHRFAK